MAHNDQILELEWLDENALRAYPLKPRPNDAGLPDNCILDAFFLGVDKNVLALITWDGARVTYRVGGDPGTRFVVPGDATFPYYAYAGRSVLVVGCHPFDMTSTWTKAINRPFEESVFVPGEYDGGWSGVSALRAPGAGAYASGEVLLLDGAQAGLRVDGQTVNITASGDAGAPLGCITGVNEGSCDGLVSTINGAQSDLAYRVSIAAGSNVAVIDDPANHRIYIGYDFNPQEVCAAAPPVPPS